MDVARLSEALSALEHDTSSASQAQYCAYLGAMLFGSSEEVCTLGASLSLEELDSILRELDTLLPHALHCSLSVIEKRLLAVPCTSRLRHRIM